MLPAAMKAAWKAGDTSVANTKRLLTYVDAEERIGYSYCFCSDWSTTLFSGFGYRYLSHKLKQTGLSPIRFNYNEFYIPVGLLTDYCFSSCWSLGLHFTWRPQIFSTVLIQPLGGTHWSLVETTDNFLVELPLTFFLPANSCLSLILKPFYEHWKDGESTATTSSGNALGLSRNNYNFYGIELNVAYAF